MEFLCDIVYMHFKTDLYHASQRSNSSPFCIIYSQICSTWLIFAAHTCFSVTHNLNMTQNVVEHCYLGHVIAPVKAGSHISDSLTRVNTTLTETGKYGKKACHLLKNI